MKGSISWSLSQFKSDKILNDDDWQGGKRKYTRNITMDQHICDLQNAKGEPITSY